MSFSLSLMTNLQGLNAHRNLQNIQVNINKSMKTLSTGHRINQAADDAAGLAISEKFRQQIFGLEQSKKNIKDGISLVQTMESGVESIQSILQRARVLSIQAANETLTQEDRKFIQLEIDQINEEIDRMAETVEFNTIKLLETKDKWHDYQINPNTRAVKDIGFVGLASCGIYNVEINEVARKEIQKTSARQANYHVDIFETDFTSDPGAISGEVSATSDLTGALIISPDGTIEFDFGGTVEQLNFLQNSDDTFLVEGAHYNYDAVTNNVQLLNHSENIETNTISGGDVTKNLGTNTIRLNIDKTIESIGATNLENVTELVKLNNINGGAARRIYVDGVEYSDSVSGTEITVGPTNLSETYADAGESQTIAGGFITLNDNTLEGGVNLTNLGKDLEGLNIGTVRNDEATVTGETIASTENLGDIGGGVVVHRYEIRGSNTGDESHNNSISISGGPLWNAATSNNLSDGDYFFDGVNKHLYFREDSGIAGREISYYTQWDFSNFDVELNNKRFSIDAVANGHGGTVTSNNGDEIVFLDGITYQDGLAQTLNIDLSNRRGNPNYDITSFFDDVFGGNLIEGTHFTLNPSTGEITAIQTADFFGFSTDGDIVINYDAYYDVTSYNATTGEITVGSIHANVEQIGDTTGTIHNISYNTFKDVTATYMNLEFNPIVQTSTGTTDVAVPGTAYTSIRISDGAGTFYNDYEFVGGALRITRGGDLDNANDGIPDFPIHVHYSHAADSDAAALDTTTALGDRTHNNAGLFNNFYDDDQISFSIDGNTFNIHVRPEDTINHLIENLNRAGSFADNNYTVPKTAYLPEGNNTITWDGTDVTGTNNPGGNASFTAEWDAVHNSISITPNYEGTRFDIDIIDDQVGPGNYLHFRNNNHDAQVALNPTITITDEEGDTFVSTGNSNFLHNTSEVDGIPGIRLQLHENADVGHTSILDISSLIFHAGPNKDEKLSVCLANFDSISLGVREVNITTADGAQNAIQSYSNAINFVSAYRSRLGAFINRLEHAYNFVGISKENQIAAESRIRDTDMADEMINLTKNQILSQAANAMLVQANISKQSLLQLLG